MSTKPIRIERRVDAPIERVFAAWTDPDALVQWMAPGDVRCSEASCEPRVGGRFRIVMQGEQRYVQTGEYLEIEPPHRLVFSWRAHGLPDVASRVTVTLRADGQATQLALLHEQIPDGTAYDGYEDGWSSILSKLADHLGPVA